MVETTDGKFRYVTSVQDATSFITQMIEIHSANSDIVLAQDTLCVLNTTKHTKWGFSYCNCLEGVTTMNISSQEMIVIDTKGKPTLVTELQSMKEVFEVVTIPDSAKEENKNRFYQKIMSVDDTLMTTYLSRNSLVLAA